MQRRAAFTMIELLVVVTIIAILATLTLQVVGGLLDGARDAATKATMSKVQSLLNSRAQALDRILKRKGYLAGSVEYANAQQNFSTYPVSTQKIIAAKDVERKFFPQSKIDVDQYLSPKIWNAATPISAEILYDFLTQSSVLGDSPLGTDSFSSAEVKDLWPPGAPNGLPEIVDGWGNRIRFYRWPTRLFRGGGQGAAISSTDVTNAANLFRTLPAFTGNLANDLARDPDDPLQECANIPNFETIPPRGYHTPATFHVLLIVSAGPDGVLGLYEPEDTANKGHLAAVNPNAGQSLLDDIVYLNIRAGGK